MDTTTDRQIGRAAQTISAGFNRFGLDVQRLLPPHTNTFLSPLSIGAALTALLPGARGRTATEIAAMLASPADIDEVGGGMVEIRRALAPRSVSEAEYDPENDTFRTVESESFRLSLATALFVAERYPLHTSFCDTLTDVFDSEFFSQSFEDSAAAADRINAWVSDRTEGRIPELLDRDSLKPDTRLVLANAVYFKARWLHQFSEYGTRPLPFFLRGGGRIEVPTMTQQNDFAYCADEALGVEAADLPYQEGTFMQVILPSPGRFDDLEASLSTDVLDRVDAGMSPRLLAIRLPKLELRFASPLVEILQELGMRDAFDESVSDFRGVTPHPEGLVISQVIHQAWVKVDEQGTEAAAATAITALAAAADWKPPTPTPFVVDRPFYFFIRDRGTGSVLFQGRVMDPSA